MKNLPLHYLLLFIGVILFVLARAESNGDPYIIIDSVRPTLWNYHSAIACFSFSLGGGLCCIASAICWNRRNQ